jgi:hypothetical protein
MFCSFTLQCWIGRWSDVLASRRSPARSHGVADEDIRHALDHALATEDAGEDPDPWLVIGLDRAGNLLEVVVLVTIEGAQRAIHAMRVIREALRRFLKAAWP